MLSIQKITIAVLLAFLLIVLSLSIYIYLSSTSTYLQKETEATQREITGAKNIYILNSYCTENGALIEFSNAGFSDIEVPEEKAPPPELKRYVKNSGFEKDANENNIPDFWEFTKPKTSVIIVTDLSDSMRSCMDENAVYSCPDSIPSNCQKKDSCGEDFCNSFSGDYCVRQLKYYNTSYKVKVGTDWNNCIWQPYSQPCPQDYPRDVDWRYTYENCITLNSSLGCSGSSVCDTVGKYYTSGWHDPIIERDSCEADECDIGTACHDCTYMTSCDADYPYSCGTKYNNCNYIERENCNQEICSSKGYYYAGIRGYYEWRDTCTVCWYASTRYQVTDCKENSCPAGWTEIDESNCGGCAGYEVCCGEDSSIQYNCYIKEDKCCAEREFYCCAEQKRKCAFYYYKCCDRTKERKCCATTETCGFDSKQEVASCTVGSYGSTQPPDCWWECTKEDKCYYCEDISIDLAKKLDKSLTSQLITDNYTVGLVGYGTAVESFVEPTEDILTLHNEIDSYNSNAGQTCLSCAINKSIELLKNVNGKRTVVLMTDGQANVMLNGTYDEDGAKTEAVLLASKAYNNYGITIYTVGFGDKTDEVTLKKIADITAGKYFYGNDTTELEQIYKVDLPAEISNLRDDTRKNSGNYSMKVTQGKVISDYIEINPNYNYSFSHYLMVKVIDGNFSVYLNEYDGNKNYLGNISLVNHTSSLGYPSKFVNENFSLEFPANVKYVRILYSWDGLGDAWIDDVFLGIPISCTGELNSYDCKDVKVEKGNGVLFPYFYNSKIRPHEKGTFIDVGCEGICRYNIKSSNFNSVEVDCRNKVI